MRGTPPGTGPGAGIRLTPSSLAHRTCDGIFLACVATASTLPYITGLGFYSDDWNFLGELTTADDQSPIGLWIRQWEHSADLRLRPLQILSQAALYLAFGTDPLGYHAVNAGVLALISVAFYSILRAFGLHRPNALAVAVVYALLPNYSATRFWFASFSYPLSILLTLLVALAETRAVVSRGVRLMLWKSTSLGLLLAAGLGIEIVLPFLLLLPPLVWVTAASRARPTVFRRASLMPRLVYAGSHVAVLLLVVAYKRRFASGTGFPDRSHLVDLASILALPHAGTFGVELPWMLAWSWSRTGWWTLLMAAAAGVAVAAYLARMPPSSEEGSSTGDRRRIALATAGLVVMLLGYSVFAITTRFTITSTGYGNRTATAAALGVAMIWVAGAGWISMRLPERWNRMGFGVVIGVLCFTFTVIVSGLGADQVEAWEEQREILARTRATLPSLVPGSTVILHRTCPYVGSAIVFERRDFQGALQVVYGDDSLRGDVGSLIRLETEQLWTTAVGFTGRYSYGSGLLLLDPRRMEVVPLIDRLEAMNRLGGPQTGWPAGCSPGAPDMGVPLSWLDRLLVELTYEQFP